jgi:hypothetical protein
MTPRTTMNATLPPTSIAVSRHSPALVGGAGHRAQRHGRQHQQEEAQLKTDEPGTG